MNGTFYEQLGGVAGVFEQWGACERTVVACALARRVPWPGLRLLQRAVEAALNAHAGRADERLECDANDEALLAGLLSAATEADDDEGGDRLRQLLTMLPLLRTDNERAKDVYVSAAPSLVQKCVDSPRRPSSGPDLCRQLLSYLLVHPALTHSDQRTLTQWLRYLENHISGNRNTESVWQQRIDPRLLPENNIWGANSTFRRTIGKNVEFRGIVDPLDTYSTDFLQESFSKNGRDVEISLEGEKLSFDVTISQPKSQRSNSLTPPSTNFLQMSSSAENLSDEPFVQKPRSFSLSSEHSLSQIRPISIMYGTTGSETRLDELRARPHSGMATVAQWLKSLRLHKYVWLFTNISYEQMMAIDEKYLEKLGVTKGARHKILVSIKKLNERDAVLAGVEAELAACGGAGGGGGGGGGGTVGGVARALERLRGVLLSPMPPASHLPATIVRLLERASQCLSVGSGAVSQAGVHTGHAGVHTGHAGVHTGHAGVHTGHAGVHTGHAGVHTGHAGVHTGHAGVHTGHAGAHAGHAGAHEEAPHVEPLSLHCWLVERALHHESFCAPELQEALRALRHRLPPRQFYRRVCDMPLCSRATPAVQLHKWRSGPSNGFHARVYRPPPPAPSPAGPPPLPRGKSHSYPPCPGPGPRPRPRAAPPGPRAPPDDYSSLDALCLQMTEQAIN